MKRFLISICALSAAVLVSGCWEFEMFSWSPDGRYLGFVDFDDGSVWRWDTQKQRPAPVPGLDRAEIERLQMFASNQAFVSGHNYPNDAAVAGLARLEMDSGAIHGVAPGTDIEWFSVSPDRKTLATVHVTGEGDERMRVLSVAPVKHPEQQRVLAEFKEDVLTPVFDKTASRLLITKAVADAELPEGDDEGTEILLIDFEGDEVAIRTLVQSFESFLIGARWVDNETIVFNANTGEGEAERADLMYLSLDGGEPERLLENVYGIFPPTIDTRGETICASVIVSGTPEQLDDDPSHIQLVTIDIESRETNQITDETFGAFAPKFHPTQNWVAYATGASAMQVRVLDVISGERQYVWRDEESRSFATAERLLADGEFGLALASYRALLQAHPESRFRADAMYQMMTLHLDPALNEFDEAVEAFSHAGMTQPMAEPVLWGNPDVAAEDPARDLMRRYATEQSKTEFEFDTDDTRDLTGVSARLTETKLHLNIGMASAHDVSGAAFADVMVLVHELDSDTGVRSITANTDWEFPAMRTVVLRHWSEANGLYDLEIRNQRGEPIVRFAATGVSPPAIPAFDIYRLSNLGDRGAIMCWFDRSTLGLRDDRRYAIQLCTTKGGIESVKGLERPREETGWDIADAFGESNTAERIDNEIAEGGKPVLKGYAFVLDTSTGD